MNEIDIYLQQQLNQYLSQQQKIPLLSKSLKLNTEQQKKFCLVFYHARGHFYKFLWTLGSFAPTLEHKNVIIANFIEEFGGKSISHEQLYIRFANAINVDILTEIKSESHYPIFLKNFNKGHIDWLLNNNWTAKWSAFSAYEYLDNTDYRQLLNLVRNFDVLKTDLGFFIVHANAKHFESTSELLFKLWQNDSESVKQGFNFILDHQLQMWTELSDYVLNN